MRRSILLAAVALSLPAVIWKPRPVRAAEVPAVSVTVQASVARF